jgi:hypothetical protein
LGKIHGACFHNELDALEFRDVAQWIARHRRLHAVGQLQLPMAEMKARPI